MKAKTLAKKLMDAVQKYGEDVIVDTFFEYVDIIKPYPGCSGSGKFVESISTDDDDEDND